MDKLLTPQEAAWLLGVKPDTLNAWRKRGHGPPYSKLGAAIRYRALEIHEWVENHKNH